MNWSVSFQHEKSFPNASICWFSNYAERPSKLFSGAEVLLTISLMQKTLGSEFETTSYHSCGHTIRDYLVPKLLSPVELGIIKKFFGHQKSMSYFYGKKSDPKIFYRIGGGRYWKIFSDFQPRFILNGTNSVSSRENYLYFGNCQHRDMALAVLSSDLFFWYFVLTTNGRGLNPFDLNELPLDISSFERETTDNLTVLAQRLMSDYQKHKELKRKFSSKTGEIYYEEFYPRKSKHIIDEIDKVLAQHYGFTEEELDFIINYDIKYRMGKEL